MKENAFSVRWPMEQVRMSRAIRTEKNNEIPNQTVARFRCCKELKAFRSRGEAKLSVVARFVVSLIARQPKRASQDRSSGWLRLDKKKTYSAEWKTAPRSNRFGGSRSARFLNEKPRRGEKQNRVEAIIWWAGVLGSMYVWKLNPKMKPPCGYPFKERPSISSTHSAFFGFKHLALSLIFAFSCSPVIMKKFLLFPLHRPPKRALRAKNLLKGDCRAVRVYTQPNYFAVEEWKKTAQAETRKRRVGYCLWAFKPFLFLLFTHNVMSEKLFFRSSRGELLQLFSPRHGEWIFRGEESLRNWCCYFLKSPKIWTRRRGKKGGNDAGPRNDEKIIINDGEW